LPRCKVPHVVSAHHKSARVLCLVCMLGSLAIKLRALLGLGTHAGIDVRACKEIDVKCLF